VALVDGSGVDTQPINVITTIKPINWFMGKV